MTEIVFIDCQSGHISRDVPPDVVAACLRMTLPELFFNLDVYGEAFSDRFLAMTCWRSDQHRDQKVTVQ
jgi:hypothetical protein